MKVVKDNKVPENKAFIIYSSTWELHEPYYAYLDSRNRLKTALRVLFTGKVKIVWSVKHSSKDKRFRLSGKPLFSWKDSK